MREGRGRSPRRATPVRRGWLCALPLLASALACATAPQPPSSPVECHPMFVRFMRPWSVGWIRGDVFTCANAVAIETHLRSSAPRGMQPL